MPRAKKGNRKDNRFQIIRVIGHTPNGEPIRKSFYGKNKDEALLKYHKYKLDVNKHEEEKKSMPIELWIEKWLYIYKEPDVKETTFASTYLRPCKNYIIPYFKGKIIQNITQADIKEFLNTLTLKSQSLIDKIVICLRGIFETAIDNDIINKNPCRNINIKSKIEKETRTFYDEDGMEIANIYRFKDGSVECEYDYDTSHGYTVKKAILGEDNCWYSSRFGKLTKLPNNPLTGKPQ